MRSLLALAVTLLAGASGAQSIPWSQLEATSKLASRERKIAERALRATASYGGCTQPVAACLAARPRPPVAWRLARYIVFLASKGLSEADVARVVDKRRASALPPKVHSIPAAGAPALGDPRAPVVLVEFADFECAHCATATPVLERLVTKRLKGKAVLYFRTYPLRVSGPRMLAAQAAHAAHRQGKFWPMARLLFERQDSHTEQGALKLAREVGLRLDTFQAAQKELALLREIEANKILGLRLGVAATPALFVNGKPFLLPKDELHLVDRVEEELELLEEKRR